jgi:ligand-binding SRPBCC domain-containing protein
MRLWYQIRYHVLERWAHPAGEFQADGRGRAMQLTVESPVRADRAEVWAAVSTVQSVNRELGPFVRMTDPTNGEHFDAEPWRAGTPVLWQLAFGVIPVDRHRVEMVALPDNGGYRETSSTWWHRVWRHERTLLDDPRGCVVRDSVELIPRRGVPAPFVASAVRRMFRSRHQHLTRQFGAPVSN